MVCGPKQYQLYYSSNDQLLPADYNSLGETFLILTSNADAYPTHTLTLEPDNVGFPEYNNEPMYI